MASKLILTTGVVYVRGGSGLELSGAFTATRSGIGTTSTDGLVLQNTTDAAAGAQQQSPRLRLHGEGWKTDATAASQDVDAIFELLPVQGTSAPTFNLLWKASINGGAYSTIHTLSSAGQHLGVDGGNATPTYSFASNPDVGMYVSGSALRWTIDNALRLALSNTTLHLAGSGMSLIWPSGSTQLFEDTDNELAQRNGANAQSFNHYGRYVSATNFNRLAIKHAVATLSNVSGATVTSSGLIPDGAVVVGVSTRVTTGLGTTNSTSGYQVGDSGDPNRWGAVVGTAAGTDTDNTDWTTTTIQLFTAATDVIITADGGDFDGTGVIVVNVDYLIGQAD